MISQTHPLCPRSEVNKSSRKATGVLNTGVTIESSTGPRETAGAMDSRAASSNTCATCSSIVIARGLTRRARLTNAVSPQLSTTRAPMTAGPPRRSASHVASRATPGVPHGRTSRRNLFAMTANESRNTLAPRATSAPIARTCVLAGGNRLSRASAAISDATPSAKRPADSTRTSNSTPRASTSNSNDTASPSMTRNQPLPKGSAPCTRAGLRGNIDDENPCPRDRRDDGQEWAV